MNRLQKKCLIASAVTHALLIGLLVIGSAFIPAKPRIEPPAFELVSLHGLLVNEQAVGGGNPKAAPPAEVPPATPIPTPKPEPAPVQPELPKPQPEPKPVVTPKPEPERKPPEPRPEEAKPVNDRFDLDKSKPKKVVERPKPSFDFNNRKKISNSSEKSDNSSNEAEETSSKAQNKQYARRNQALQSVLKNIGEGTAGGTTIDIPGPGGQAYVGYGLYLKQVYQEAWIPPLAGRDNEPVVEVEVTIARDGRVLSSRITKRSGNASLDRSVQETLNRVKKVREFPEGSKDQQRSFKINFNLTTKLNIG